MGDRLENNNKMKVEKEEEHANETEKLPDRWKKKARESEIMGDLEDCFLKARIVGTVWWDEGRKWIW